MGNTSGIILAGIHRWDDSGFDELAPRPLMPVAHTPLIGHVLAWMRSAGIAHATICGNSASRRMRQTLATGAALGIDLSYFEDWTPRGPAGCIRDAVLDLRADRFVVAEGTILPIRCELIAVLAGHARTGADLTVVAAHDPNTSRYGVERCVPVGIYVFERRVMDHIPAAGYQDVKEVLLPRLYDQGLRVEIHPLPAPCPRVSDASSYLSVSAGAVERIARGDRVLPGYRRIGESIVHESARISSAARLVGPILVGQATLIAGDATIAGPTTVGAECVVEPGAVISHSVLWDGCWVGRGAAVNHCVLGYLVTVKPEAMLCRSVCAADPARRRRNGAESRPDWSWSAGVTATGRGRSPIGPEDRPAGDRHTRRMTPTSSKSGFALRGVR